MRTKKIVVPIYEFTITLIYTDDLEEIGTKFNIKDPSGCRAIVFKRRSMLYATFGPYYHLSDIAHEVVHIVNHIYEYYGIKHDLINDEPTAYLTGFLFEKIHDFLTLKVNNNGKLA